MVVQPTDEKRLKIAPQMFTEGQGGKSRSDRSGSGLEGPGMVEFDAEHEKRLNTVQKEKEQSPQRQGTRNKRSRKIPGRHRITRHSFLEEMVEELDACEGVKDLILNSWRPKTRMQYEVYLRQWHTFCLIKGFNHKKPALRQVHTFLYSLFKKGLTYSAVNTARSALSAYLRGRLDMAVGAHWMTSKLLTGVRLKRPPLSRYQATWDVNVVLELLSTWVPVRKLTLKLLTFKLCMLMLLTSCQRVQTLATLKVADIFWDLDGGSVTFRLTEMLKHTKRGTLGMVHFSEFTQDRSLCVITVLKEYLTRTKPCRKSRPYLFLSHRKPFDCVTKGTISSWIRTIMAIMAGLDVRAFKAHSVRGASTSKLASLNIPVDLIMRKASWSNENTFKKFYHKHIIPPQDVANSMLSEFMLEKFKD